MGRGGGSWYPIAPPEGLPLTTARRAGRDPILVAGETLFCRRWVTKAPFIRTGLVLFRVTISGSSGVYYQGTAWVVRRPSRVPSPGLGNIGISNPTLTGFAHPDYALIPRGSPEMSTEPFVSPRVGLGEVMTSGENLMLNFPG